MPLRARDGKEISGLSSRVLRFTSPRVVEMSAYDRLRELEQFDPDTAAMLKRAIARFHRQWKADTKAL